MTSTVIAHTGVHALLREATVHWTWEPITIALVVLSAALYGRGVGVLWERAGVGTGIARWQVLAFGAGLLTLSIALLSPVAWLSHVLFSVHMTQHEILMLLSAPLLVFSTPLQAFMWALSSNQRESVGHLTRRPAIHGSWRLLTSPASAFVLHAVALWAWHVPVLYEAALRSDAIHGVQHASFLLTATLFWWGMVHGRYGRTGYGIAVFYVFVTAMHSGLLGALMTLGSTLWYPSYARTTAAWHVDPIVDQQLAGLLMWVPAGVVFIVFGLALMAAWLGESDRRVTFASSRLPTSERANSRPPNSRPPI